MRDLVVRNGTIVDGTGGPARTGDLAIDDGVIAEVGHVDARGRHEIDADGALVTPGFVDVHTHYDGQVTWDPLLTPSIWHGVTTVVMGNCGVGFAPAAPSEREWLIGLMEGVEDIPGTALHEGIRWEWEHFPEYLDALDRFPRAIDVGAQVAHGAVRFYVMGGRGAANEPATSDDIARMAEIVHGAVAAGALGFTTNRLPLHRTVNGDPVPGTFADEIELTALVEAAASAARCTIGAVLAGSMGEDLAAPAREIDLMARLSRASGLPITFALGQLTNAPNLWRELLDRIEQHNADGAWLAPQVPCRPLGLLLGLSTKHAFTGRPTYDALSDLPLPQRAARMRDPQTKQRILGEQQGSGQSPLAGLIFALLDRVFPLGDPPNYEPRADESVAARARQLGVDPRELFYDLLAVGDGAQLLLFTLGGYAEANLDFNYELLQSPTTVLGLGDGGAHVGLICDSSYPTLLLDHWVRRRNGPRLSLEQAVRALTSEPAELFGLDDRGVIAPGRKADVNVLDPDRLRVHLPESVHDLPAGARRLVQRADGYVATIVSGEVVQREGVDTGARPGRLVRGGRAAT